MTIKLSIMTAEEAFKLFQTEEMKQEYQKELSQIDTECICNMRYFLDNYAEDIERLTESQCELLNLEYEDGFYISTWNNEYLSK